MSASGGAFAIGFRELERWDPASFYGIAWHWPPQVMASIGSVLRLRREKVDRTQYDFANLQPITIHFDGSIDRREVEAGREYTMDLQFAHPGDVVAAKIDLKNGAAGIVPDWGDVVVTNHFAVYEPDRDRLLPEYLTLLIQTSFFKAYLWRNKVGAEGRKEVKLDFFESILIPLPPLDVQRAIVARWQAAQAKIDAAKGSLRQVIDDLNSRLYEIYRRECAQDVLGKRWMAVRWATLPRWDAKTARASAFRTASLTFVPLGQFAEEATETVRPWEQPEKDWPVYGVNNKDGVFFSYYQRGEEFNAPYKRIRKDWFFHNPTRSSVGSLGMVPEVPDDAITSPEYQVWRIKQGLHPGYVAVLINTPFFISLIQFHRVGAVKQRLYVENLLEIPIPIIPFDEQASIAQARGLALESVAEAARIRTAAAAEVEALILGTTEAPDLRPAAWEAEHGYLAQLSDQGPVPGGRTWKREDLYEETRDAEAT